jgi:hypothetical protein
MARGSERHHARARVLPRGELRPTGPEPLREARFHRLRLHVPDEDHGHQLRPVPGPVEPLELLARGAGDHLLRADRQALREARPREEPIHDPLAKARLHALAHPLLLQDDAALLLDLRGEQELPEDEVRKHLHPLVDPLRGRVGQEEHVGRLVVAGEGVRAVPEDHADALEVRDERPRREVLRAVERHVLQEVREPALRLGLVQGAGPHVDDHGELARRGPVLPKEVADPVLQRAGEETRVRGQRPVGRSVGEGRGRRDRDGEIRDETKRLQHGFDLGRVGGVPAASRPEPRQDIVAGAARALLRGRRERLVQEFYEVRR